MTSRQCHVQKPVRIRFTIVEIALGSMEKLRQHAKTMALNSNYTYASANVKFTAPPAVSLKQLIKTSWPDIVGGLWFFIIAINSIIAMFASNLYLTTRIFMGLNTILCGLLTIAIASPLPQFFKRLSKERRLHNLQSML